MENEKRKEFIAELETFGGLVHGSLGKDFGRSVKAMKSLNAVLENEPRLISFIMNEQNQEALGELIGSFNGREPSFKDFPKIIAVFSKLKA